MNAFLNLLKSRGVTAPPKDDVRVIGIDLGTTNSTVSELVWKAGAAAPEPVRTLDIDQETPAGRHTGPLVPSVVCARPNHPLVGQGAKTERGRIADKDTTLRQKRDIFWETKNDMGLTRTYHQAPKGFNSAKEIAGHILKFLIDQPRQENPATIARTIVTVPASFRIPQRQDTQKAAELAGIAIGPGDLVDEPVAAFLDYVFSHDISQLELTAKPKNLLVFDFGGGTCDVAIFRVSIDRTTAHIAMTPLTVSRYHRLGGGDIDAAIVHELLIPQLAAQNRLAPFELSFEDKAQSLTPALLSIAESLKIGLCKEIVRLTKLARYPDGDDRKTVFKRNPGVTECTLRDGRVLSLNAPVITAFDFEKLLIPFLDRDYLFARESEYRMTCSIFAPLTDALNRAGLEPKDIGVCLMAGSSSFIPHVQQEVDRFFTNGFVLNFATPEDAKLAISRGAAYHALALHLTGAGIIQPITSDAVLLQTSSEPVQLVPAGQNLPFPGPDTWGVITDLKVPAFKPGNSRTLRLELITPDQMQLCATTWVLPDEIRKATPLRLEYQVDANQVMRFRLNVADAPTDDYWEWQIENPLVNIEYTESKRAEIEIIEENIRTARIPRVQIPDALIQVAELTADLGHRERALDLMKKSLAAKHGEDAGLLNRMGILCGEMRDHQKEQKFYRDSARISQWGTPLFNLALSQKRRGLNTEAMATIDEAIARHKAAPYLVLRAMIADVLRDTAKRDADIKVALTLFGTIQNQSDWELGWYLAATEMQADDATAKGIREEQRRRSQRRHTPTPEGELPDRGQS